MTDTRKTYDLIFSLGGSCTSASQLRRYYHLQYESFPMDWVAHEDATTLTGLAHMFENHFEGWMTSENLRPSEEREVMGAIPFQYVSTLTEHRFPHDFKNPKTDEKFMHTIHDKYQRRIERLWRYIEKSQRILLILDTRLNKDYDISFNTLQSFLDVFNRCFPGKEVDFFVFAFQRDKDEVLSQGAITIQKFTRRCTEGVNLTYADDWHLLKRVALSRRGYWRQRLPILRSQILTIRRLKHGISFAFLNRVFNILQFRISLLSINFEISIGKQRF